MLDKEEFFKAMNKGKSHDNGYLFMITNKVVKANERSSYITVEIKKATALEELDALYEDIKDTHKISKNATHTFPRFNLNEQPEDQL